MTTVQTETTHNNTNYTHPKSRIIEESDQEKQFDELLRLWVFDKISLETLMLSYPDFDENMIKKVMKKLVALFP